MTKLLFSNYIKLGTKSIFKISNVLYYFQLNFKHKIEFQNECPIKILGIEKTGINIQGVLKLFVQTSHTNRK